MYKESYHSHATRMDQSILISVPYVTSGIWWALQESDGKYSKILYVEAQKNKTWFLGYFFFKKVVGIDIV